MEIQWVTLRNFKSHRDRRFVFQSGTNAICGENGAGKTSILEAIAWVIFDYKGNYKKEDFIHNGCANAQVTVRFISSKDGRTYDILRCTDKGYTLYDPQLDARLDYKNIDQEVLPWLRQHIGVTPDTDLAHLFANTIGIPQGTYTADFLLSPEKRKRVFDVILKLEVYRQVCAHLSKVERYASDRKQRIEHQITQYEKISLNCPPPRSNINNYRWMFIHPNFVCKHCSYNASINNNNGMLWRLKSKQSKIWKTESVSFRLN
ncbi:MAG: SMC family ATPase [Cyanobacteria bacterium LVE1205-1]|jgi:exonuclease SbcC